MPRAPGPSAPVPPARAIGARPSPGCGSSDRRRRRRRRRRSPSRPRRPRTSRRRTGRRCPTSSTTCPRARCSRPSVSVLDQGPEPLRLRALRHRPQADLRRRRGALHRQDRRLGRARPVRRAQRVAGGQARSSRASRPRPTPTRRKAVYVADVPFTAQRQVRRPRRSPSSTGGCCRTNPFASKVGGEGNRPPGPGDKAPLIHTLTPADVGGDAGEDRHAPARRDRRCSRTTSPTSSARSRSCSRSPRRSSARAASAARSSTSSSRCRSKVGDKVAFIHQEIYKDNDGQQGPAAAAGRLPPADRALDVRDRPQRRRSSTRFEGAFSAGELERAVAKVDN